MGIINGTYGLADRGTFKVDYTFVVRLIRSNLEINRFEGLTMTTVEETADV
jgi:hypothetical protein